MVQHGRKEISPMTDKKEEIIINEINLKECKYFKGVGCINSSFKFWGCTKLGGMCSEHPDCYFKQLKRKKQECEELREQKRLIEDAMPKTGAEFCEIIQELYRAFDEIEEIIDNGTKDTQTNNAKWLQQHYLARFREIQNVVDKVKDGE